MKTYSYVITRTPLRVSFLGGGTDFEYFYKNYGGSVINSAINKYVYVTVKKHSKYFNENYRLNYSKSETQDKLTNVKNNIIRECLKITNTKFPIYISTIADVPSGSGLGGSSSFTVGLLNGLYAIKGRKISKKKLFNLARKVEIDILKQPIGKQDQLAATYGGLRYIKFNKNKKLIIKKLKSDKNIFNKMRIFWTGSSRNASDVLKDQKKNLSKNISNLKEIKKISDYFYKNTRVKKKIDLKLLGNLMFKSWERKKQLSKKIQNFRADKLIKNSIKLNFYGGKLLGAGGSGFVLLIKKNSNYNSIIKKFKKLKSDNINIDKNGSEIICKY